MKTYRTALVLGCGRSGAGAARLLAREGAQVVVVDAQRSPELEQRATILRDAGMAIELGATSLPAGDFDVCVVSPGIPDSSAWVTDAKARGLYCVSELELGWSRLTCPVIAVTGSNGKSTAVKWLAESLDAAGHVSVIAGNYGVSVCETAMSAAGISHAVLEVSSFQLETVDQFRPRVGVLLNVLPNHLDRHGDMDTYMALKARLFAQMGEHQAAVVREDLAPRIRELSGARTHWITFGAGRTAEYRYDAGRILHSGERIADLSNTIFANDILGVTAAGVVAGLRALNVPERFAVDAARRFEPLPHRMQKVAQIKGVTFVNDSKATNLAALEAAVRMAGGRVRLIAGGLAKETDFKRVKEILAERVASVYLIGKSAEGMFSAWSASVPCNMCGTLDKAVQAAWSDAKPDETILLAPGCASFDQFRNYEERGETYVGHIRDLAGEEAQ